VADEKEMEAVNADMERRNDYRTGCAEGAPESSGPLQLRNCQRMANVRIPMAVCAAVNEILIGSHPVLDAKFQAAGALGPPPDLPHHSKWKTWLFKAGNDPNVDSLGFLGNLIEEFMDLPPAEADPTVDFFGAVQDPVTEYQKKRERINRVLEENGFRYYRGGRVLPTGQQPELPTIVSASQPPTIVPSEIDALLRILISGMPRAIFPLAQRRKNALSLSFDSEYDIQDLLHAMLRPWVADIRPEEYAPSYAGKMSRMDFLLPKYKTVIETKRVRDRSHAKDIGDELIIDIEHYRRHPECDYLWCAVYDPNRLLPNPNGLKNDLDGARNTLDGTVKVCVHVF
jgi:hypothetical protein